MRPQKQEMQTMPQEAEDDGEESDSDKGQTSSTLPEECYLRVIGNSTHFFTILP